MKNEKENVKGERKKENKKGRVFWTFHSLTYLPHPGETVLPNVSPKRFLLH
jgi:hypothetical protein